MMKNDEIIAVLKMLKMSVNRGLNASLSPRDCQILLNLISTRNTPYQKTLQAILSRLDSFMSQGIEDVFDSLAGKPGKGRR